MAVSRYVTLRAIKHSGSDFAANTPIALSDEYAAPLLSIGAIQGQAGALPTMPTAPGDVVRETLDTGSGGKARSYLEAIPSEQANANGLRGLVLSSDAGAPAAVLQDYPVFHKISMRNGKRAEVGPDFISARNGAGSVFCFAKNGLLRWVRTKTQEQELGGAHRVHNLVPAGQRFRTGWTAGANVTLTDLYEQGPNGEISVTRLQRSSGSGAFLTLNSAGYVAGQKTASIWMSSEKAITVQMQIQEQSGTVVETVSFTPPPRIAFDVRACVSAVIRDTTKLYKLQFLSTTSVLDIKISDAAFEHTDGLDPVPGPYLNPNKIYDFGASGVKYFLDYGYWVASATAGICKPATPTKIDPAKILGYQIQPSWANRDLYSDDLRNAVWTKTGVATIDGSTIYADSTLFGPGTLMPITEDTSVGEHAVTQTPSGTFEANKIYTRWAYFLADTASQVAVGFMDRNGVKRWASVDLTRLAVMQTSGTEVISVSVKLIGDLIEVAMSDKSGTGSGTMTDFVALADATGAISYAGTSRKVYVARTCFAKVDHAMVPLSPNTSSVGAGCGDSTNAVMLDKHIPSSSATFFADFVFPEPGLWPARSGWKFLLYWIAGLDVRNQWGYVDIRGGLGQRGGVWSGATVEGFVDPETGQTIPGQYMFVVDWYRGASYMMANGTTYHETFSVVMVPVTCAAGVKLRIYFSLRPSDVGTGSNVSMRASDQDGYLDINSSPSIEALPPGVTMRLGYNEQNLSATAQMWISNFTVLGYGMTMDEMAKHLRDNPVI